MPEIPDEQSPVDVIHLMLDLVLAKRKLNQAVDELDLAMQPFGKTLQALIPEGTSLQIHTVFQGNHFAVMMRNTDEAFDFHVLTLVDAGSLERPAAGASKGSSLPRVDDPSPVHSHPYVGEAATADYWMDAPCACAQRDDAGEEILEFPDEGADSAEFGRSYAEAD